MEEKKRPSKKKYGRNYNYLLIKSKNEIILFYFIFLQS